MSKEAMKLALEALKQIDEAMPFPVAKLAQAVLREALAEYCVCGEPNTPGTHRTDGPCLAEQPAQQEAKIVRWNCPCGNKYTFHGFTEAPPQRTWVGLTQQDIDIAFDDTQEGGGFDDFARTIEAKLKEKNNA